MKRALRWAGYGLLGVLGVAVAALAALYGYSEYRIERRYEIHPPAVAVRADAELVARGRHLATIRGCVDCHGANLGGQTFLDTPPVGRVFASNLTRGRGGIGGSYTDQDFVRAIRHGVRPNGQALLIMPAQEFNVLSDADVAALIAYLRSLPPVDNEPFERSVGPIGRLLYVTGQAPLLPVELIDHTARPKPVTPGVTAEYGKYLSSSCVGCHGEGLSGGRIPGMPPEFPPAANITPHGETGIGAWTEADFFTALRTGKRPDGSELRPEMPWKLTAQMTDDEIRALWLYLRTVPAREYGKR